MKLKYCLLIMCSVLFFAERASAQAIIGNNTTPKDYAVLEVAGVGGIRLPSLTTAERGALNLTDGKAGGLVIYNKTDNCFQFWSGTAWASLKKVDALAASSNGIAETVGAPGTVEYKLGGSLTENTTISQKGNNLFFNVTTGRFSIQDSAFIVQNGGVGIGTLSPAAALDIYATSQGKGFCYKYPEAPTSGVNVLTSDADGYASWESLIPTPVKFTASMLAETTISSLDATENPVAISQSLTLGKGIYMIIARYVGIGDTKTSAGWGYNSWIRLRKDGTATDIATIGQIPQLGNGSYTTTLNEVITTPQLMFILSVPEGGASYTLYGDLRGVSTNPIVKIKDSDSTYGSSYFQAIKLTN